ncbi:ABC transporter [Propionigenium maris DSM 9537]|uniref:ABC transporter n=1 Tax=Propionigenium maris DSM 9537 TaxID=1123000 RepID=A0A9W6GKV5_9FUSO|nr:FtsX-like permease family protein [Propionigenium maris]GLI56979.1 ABC transporter [Propionigenium maris DSM 9537]
MIVRMAYRNIFRHRVRTILTLISLALGIFFIVLGVGVNIGMERRVIKVMRATEVGDGKVYGRGYFEDRYDNVDDRLDFPVPQKALEILEGYPHSRRLIFSGMVTDGVYDYPVRIIGGERKAEEELFNRSSYIVEGKGGVVISHVLARDLGLSVGDSIVLTATTARESFNAMDLTITGIIKTGGLEFDLNTLLIDIDLAQEFAETDIYNDIAVRGEIAPSDIAAMEAGGAEVISYLEELSDIIAVTKIKIKVVMILSSVILIISGVGIVNTMLMGMLERQREIGILLASGMKPKDIMKLFLLEGGILGVIGSGIGFILGGALVYHYERVGIPLPDMAQKMKTTIPLSDRIYGYFDLRMNLIFFLFGVVIATGAALYPAYKATKLNPVDVLRE